MFRTTLSLPALMVALTIGVFAYAEDKENKLPDNVKAILDKAEEIELISLQQFPLGHEDCTGNGHNETQVHPRRSAKSPMEGVVSCFVERSGGRLSPLPPPAITPRCAASGQATLQRWNVTLKSMHPHSDVFSL